MVGGIAAGGFRAGSAYGNYPHHRVGMANMVGNPTNVPGGGVAVTSTLRGMIHNGPQVYYGNGRFFRLEAAYLMLKSHFSTLLSIRNSVERKYRKMKLKLELSTDISSKHMINSRMYTIIKMRAKILHQLHFVTLRLRVLRSHMRRAEYYKNGNSYHDVSNREFYDNEAGTYQDDLNR